MITTADLSSLKPFLDLQARKGGQIQSAQSKSMNGGQTSTKHNLVDASGITLAVQGLWSSMVDKLVQQDLRAKKFDEIWPGILDEMILKGFAGTY